MRLNGHMLIINRAVEISGVPILDRYRNALILGAFREDVWYVPVIKRVVEHLSLTHNYRPGLSCGYFPFVPGPAPWANRIYRGALREARADRWARAFVQLGRVVHLVVDMCCPVHAKAVPHLGDPYEWYVEGNRERLEGLPIPPIPEAERPSQLIHSLARVARHYEADRTNNLPGWIMQRLGLWAPLTKKATAAQAEVLIPLGVAHTASLLQLFLQDARVEVSA